MVSLRPITRRTTLLLACLWLLTLPSCTVRLWQGPERVVKTVLSSESSDTTAGTVAVCGEQIIWRTSEGAEQVATLSGPNAEQVRLLLCSPDYDFVSSVRLESVEVFVNEQLVDGGSRLVVRAKPGRRGDAYVVSKSTLTAAALAGLSKGVLGDARVPTACRDLLTRLPLLDLGAAIGRPSAYTLVSQVYLKADGTPAFTSELSPELARPEPSERERLKQLSQVSMLLQLEGPEGTLFVRAKPDLLWLGSRFHPVGGEPGVMRASLTWAQPDALPAASTETQTWPAEHLQRVTNYTRITSGDQDLSVWSKIALTPLALAGDALAIVLLGAFVDDDDDDDECLRRIREEREHAALRDRVRRLLDEAATQPQKVRTVPGQKRTSSRTPIGG